MKKQPSNQTSDPDSVVREKTTAVGNFPTQKQRIDELRAKASARDGRNALIALAILGELDRPRGKRESDRALGRRLGVDHKTIARWRNRVKGKRLPRGIISRRKLLGLCQTLAGLNVVVMARKLVPADIRNYIGPASGALSKFMRGPRTSNHWERLLQTSRKRAPHSPSE